MRSTIEKYPDYDHKIETGLLINRHSDRYTDKLVIRLTRNQFLGIPNAYSIKLEDFNTEFGAIMQIQYIIYYIIYPLFDIVSEHS